jgi:hypothetical protein
MHPQQYLLFETFTDCLAYSYAERLHQSWKDSELKQIRLQKSTTEIFTTSVRTVPFRMGKQRHLIHNDVIP